MIEISPCPEAWVDEFDHWHDWVMTEKGPPALGLEDTSENWHRLYVGALNPDRGLRCDSAIARTGKVMSVILRERHLWRRGDSQISDALGLTDREYEIITQAAYERFITHYQVMLDAVKLIRYARKHTIRSCV